MHGASDVGVGDGVGVGVEPGRRPPCETNHRQDEVGVEGPLGEGPQAGLFDEEPLGGTLARGGVDALVGGLVAPRGGLRAHVLERREPASVEEREPPYLMARLDLPLRLGVADGGRGDLEEVVPGEGEEPRVELHRGADVVQDNAFEVVVEDLLGDAAEELERAAVHEGEGLHALVEGEVEEEGARPGQDHHEGAERALGGAHAHVTEAPPIDLRLLAGLDLDAQVGLPAARGAHLRDAQRRSSGEAVRVAALLASPRRAAAPVISGCMRDSAHEVGLNGIERGRARPPARRPSRGGSSRARRTTEWCTPKRRATDSIFHPSRSTSMRISARSSGRDRATPWRRT